MENSSYQQKPPKVGEVWKVRTTGNTRPSYIPTSYQVERIYEMGKITMVEGRIITGVPEAVGNTYQWSLNTVMLEDTPDEVSVVQRLLDEYEVEGG
jgi:hypothetical protein